MTDRAAGTRGPAPSGCIECGAAATSKTCYGRVCARCKRMAEECGRWAHEACRPPPQAPVRMLARRVRVTDRRWNGDLLEA